MKVFLSHPMYGTSGGEVLEIREKAYEYLKNKYGEDVKLIDNYSHEDAPENSGRLWHLGRSIQQLEEADTIYLWGLGRRSRMLYQRTCGTVLWS